MKTTFLCAFSLLAMHFTQWHYNLDEATQIAKKENRHILLNFSGSDWCGPCIRMQKEIFNTEVFNKMADSELVLVSVDFPRMRKNRLSPQQQIINNKIADQYNSKGKFPFTVLLNSDGKVLMEWDGFPDLKPEQFSSQIKSIIDGELKHT
jgi:thioredoxin-related protein